MKTNEAIENVITPWVKDENPASAVWLIRTIETYAGSPMFASLGPSGLGTTSFSRCS